MLVAMTNYYGTFSLFYEHEDFYADIDMLMSAKNGGVAVARGWSVSKVDPANRKVYLEDGKEISYRKCLIATGAKPKNLPVFENAKQEVKDKVRLAREKFVSCPGYALVQLFFFNQQYQYTSQLLICTC